MKMADIMDMSYSDQLARELDQHRALITGVELNIQALEEMLKGMRDVLAGLKIHEEIYALRIVVVRNSEIEIANRNKGTPEFPPRIGLVPEGDTR